MEIIQIKRKALVLDGFEARRLAGLLEYAKHRLSQHTSAGITNLKICHIDTDFADYCLKKVSEIAT